MVDVKSPGITKRICFLHIILYSLLPKEVKLYYLYYYSNSKHVRQIEVTGVVGLGSVWGGSRN